ncbi:MAG: hypothetical protein LBD12_02065 [Clostridiales Family XIII bacterium]|jgi:hypothetical protein|nr:hypothetical protein [Clostridiales Family XIII bacterium]
MDTYLPRSAGTYRNESFLRSGRAWSYGTIQINSEFVKNPSKSHSIDKLIDTLTHETEHLHQFAARKNPKKFGLSKSLAEQWEPLPEENLEEFEAYYNQYHERDARAFAAVSRPDER